MEQRLTQENIVVTSIKDFFSSRMLKFSVAPFFISVLLVYTTIFYLAHLTLKDLRHATLHVQKTQTTIVDGLESIDSYTTDFQGSSVMEFLMSHSFTSWLVSFFFYTMGSMLALIITIFISLIIISFLTPYILKEIQQKHYSEVAMKGYDNFFWSILKLSQRFVIMLGMFLLFIPFYFIPILNVIMFNLPMYYFFHKTLTYDVASSITTKNEYKKIMFFSGTEIRVKSFVLYLLSLIPFVILFTGVYYVIFMGHTFFKETHELRTNDAYLA
jgi:Etoposide-induced protein 2.4 (EI24)